MHETNSAEHKTKRVTYNVAKIERAFRRDPPTDGRDSTYEAISIKTGTHLLRVL